MYKCQTMYVCIRKPTKTVQENFWAKIFARIILQMSGENVRKIG